MSADIVDACLGHPEAVTGMYHYHILSPCIITPTNITNNLTCAGISTCAKSIKSYAIQLYTKTENILAVAKDGRMIVAPYKKDGTLYDCKLLDLCGGISITDEAAGSSYVYVF